MHLAEITSDLVEPLNSVIPSFFIKPSWNFTNTAKGNRIKRRGPKSCAKDKMGFHCQQHLRHCCLMVWIVSCPTCPSPFTFRTHNEEKDVGVIAMDPLGLLASCFRYCSKWMLYGAIAHEWLVGSGGLWSGVARFYFSTSFVCHVSIQSGIEWMSFGCLGNRMCF